MKDKLSPEYITQLSKTVQSRIPMEIKQLLKELEEYDRYVHIALRHRLCPMCGASIISTFEPYSWNKMQSFCPSIQALFSIAHPGTFGSLPDSSFLFQGYGPY